MIRINLNGCRFAKIAASAPYHSVSMSSASPVGYDIPNIHQIAPRVYGDDTLLVMFQFQPIAQWPPESTEY